MKQPFFEIQAVKQQKGGAQLPFWARFAETKHFGVQIAISGKSRPVKYKSRKSGLGAGSWQIGSLGQICGRIREFPDSTVGIGKCVSADRRSTQKSGRGLQRETAFGSGRESQKAKLARPPEGKSPDFEKHAQNSAQIEIRPRNEKTLLSKQP